MAENITELEKELQEIKEDAEKKLISLKKIGGILNEEEKKIEKVLNTIDEKLSSTIEKDLFLAFFKKPYAIIPQGKNKIIVAVPKFIKNFQVGWLWKETPSFYLFQFDQYSAWLGDAPKELLEEINFKKELDGYVVDNMVYFEPNQKENIKKKLGWHLKEIGESSATIIRGHAFDVIAEMIEAGCLPFRPHKVDEKDLREGKSEIKLRPYQKEAVKKFMETGAIGVFHPTGAGKSFIALNLIDIIKGDKLIIVPTRTLIEQWKYYIETYIPHCKDEIKISTYQGYRMKGEEYSLTIFDEMQFLPADTFSRLATIKTQYRAG